MTQLQSARMGIVTEAMKIVAADEGIEVERVRAAVASGEAVIPLNVHHINARPVGVGRLFRTKINANLGRSVTHSGKGDELEKLAVALKAGATYGASLLCYVTPAEHLGLPDEEEVHQGCIAYRIAAHAGDVARGLPGARKIDDEMAKARASFDWDRQFGLCLDPECAQTRWLKTRSFMDEAHDDDHCSMCGKQFCAVRTSRRIRELARCAES